MKRVLLTAAAALAIAAGQSNWAAGAVEAAPPAADARADDFVKTASIANLYEIEAGRIAAQRAQSAEVKALAQMFVEDHTQIGRNMASTLKTSGLGIVPPDHLDAHYEALIQQLEAASAGDFDRIYLHQQLTAHAQALRLMDGYAAHGDQPALRALASKTAPIIRRHLNEVRRIGGGAFHKPA